MISIQDLKKENGFTLVELLATFVLLSIVSFLMITAIIFGVRQSDEQTARAERNNEIRDAMSVIIRDIRDPEYPGYFVEGSALYIGTEEDRIIYAHDPRTNELHRRTSEGENIISDKVEQFIPDDSFDDRIEISIISTDDIRAGDKTELESAVYKRR